MTMTMNEQAIKDLFNTKPFSEAKAELVQYLESNGETITGNEMIFELKAKCLKLAQMNTNEEHIVVHGNSHEDIDDLFEEEERTDNIAEEENATSSSQPDEEGDEEKNLPQPMPMDNTEEENSDLKENVSGEEENKEKGGTENTDENDKDESDNGEQDKKQRRKRRTKEEIEKQKKEQLKEQIDKKSEAMQKLQEEMQKLQEEKEKIEKEEEERKRKEEEERKRKEEEERKKNENDSVYLDEVVKRLKTLHKAFLVGPAGTGKSTLAMKACEKIFNIEGGIQGVVNSDKFAQISFSPDTVSADMIGFTDVHGVFHETDIVRVFRDGGVILFDEMDDADASLLVKLNTMLANGVLPTPNGMVTQNPNTYIVGTANTYGKGGNAMYVGRNRLDAATLDRWKLATVSVNYDEKLERKIMESGIHEKQQIDVLESVVKTIRTAIELNRFKQICSTRFVVDATKMIANGYAINQIVNTFLLDWGENESRLVKRAIADATRTYPRIK